MRIQHRQFLINAGATVLAMAAVFFSVRSMRRQEDPIGEMQRELNAIDAGLVGMPAVPKAPYDWETAKLNLERIGKCLQIYRKAQKPKPPEKRRSFKDAGLPEHFFAELTEERMPWSAPRICFLSSWSRSDKATIKLVNSVTGVNHLRQIYGAEDSSSDPKIWSKRGENIPVLLDSNMTDPKQSSIESPEVLVLRLNGRVDRVKWKVGEPLSALEAR